MAQHPICSSSNCAALATHILLACQLGNQSFCFFFFYSFHSDFSCRRADRRIHFNGAKLCVRNGGHSAGFDEKNQFKIFIWIRLRFSKYMDLYQKHSSRFYFFFFSNDIIWHTDREVSILTLNAVHESYCKRKCLTFCQKTSVSKLKTMWQ